MSDNIWDGSTGNVERDFARTEGKVNDVNSHEFHVLTREIIAAQNGVAVVSRYAKDLENTVHTTMENVRTADDWNETVASLLETAETLVEDSQQGRQIQTEAITHLRQSLEAVTSQLTQWQTLLAGFNSVDEAQYWLTQASRFRRWIVARGFHRGPAECVEFPQESQVTAARKNEELRQQIKARDKTFRIAQPMRKVSWTKCFAAGGRSVRGWVGRGSTEGAVEAIGGRNREGDSSPCAQHEESRALVRCRTRLKRVA